MSDIPTLSSHHMPAGQPLLRELEGYWRELCADGRLPRRRALDPARIDAALPHSFVLQKVAPGIARFRATGQRISRIAGEEARGFPISALFTAAARPVLRDHLRAVFDTPAIVEMPIDSRRVIGSPHLEGRLLLLPLLDEDERVTAALGAMMTDGAIGTAPRRFDIPLGAPLRCEAVTDRSRALAALAIGAHAAGMAKSPAVGRAHLRLVVDNG